MCIVIAPLLYSSYSKFNYRGVRIYPISLLVRYTTAVTAALLAVSFIIVYPISIRHKATSLKTWIYVLVALSDGPCSIVAILCTLAVRHVYGIWCTVAP